MSANANWKAGLRPELELVLCCAHTHPDRATAARIREILRGPLNWSNIVAIGFEHHVESFLYENLRLFGGGLVPDACLETMRESARKTGGMAVLFSSELLRVQEIFDAERVPLIPYKGPVLGWLAYQSLTLRRFLDLDFFVPQKHIPRAAALLESAGYDSKFKRPEELAGRAGCIPGQYGFLHAATRTQIELHTERTLRYFPVPLDFETMSRRLIAVEVYRRRLQTFSVEDTLVMLSVHGAKHLWERLIWILDLAQLISVRDVDWGLLMAIAAKMQSTRVLLLGVYLAHDFFGATLPATVLQNALAGKQLQWLAAQVREKYAGISDPSAGVWPRTVFRIRSRDGTVQGIRHVLRLAVSPTEIDRDVARLPAFLTPLYILVRPWRLLREYGSGLKHGPKPVAAIEPSTRPLAAEEFVEKEQAVHSPEAER